MISLVTGSMMGVINTYFIGHIGSESHVAGAGMANMLNNIVARSVLYGVTDSLNTFVSQAFGNKDYYMCGVYLNRARVLICIVYVIVVMILQFSYLFFEITRKSLILKSKRKNMIVLKETLI